MYTNPKLILTFWIAMQLVSRTTTMVEFTNIRCEAVDKEYCTFEYCQIKSVNRTYKYLSVKAKILQLPITNAKVNGALYQRLNGYKPFLYNITLDCCKFVKNQKSNPVASFFYDTFKEFSNLNHSCPFNHDIVLDKLTAESINHRVTRILPFPEGQYMLQLNFNVSGINRVILKIYLALS
ncbi:uncharacterized protein LOC120444898 [Drosophila santomea]|uniref:uncharacterized protein LOC120444898 n=1 Tax=Drosophila santomea TaxID=129105 RepID=UPI001953EC1D|nr:uncharacterized protein LOC120444898 [Drosophila santomea]